MITRRTVLRHAIAASALLSMRAVPARADELKLPRVKLNLAQPPFVHTHEQATTEKPKIFEVTLTANEEERVIDNDGTKIWAMDFNGSIPAPMIVLHQDDYLEVTLVNPPTNTMPHNIDFHAATGAMGGSDLTLVNPGEQATLRFKAMRTGVFLYHCWPGGDFIPWHIASGMSGCVMVLPRDGLKDGAGKPLHYDRIYYIGEQDFYVPRDKDGKFKTYASPTDAFTDAVAALRTLTPTHIVFEGKVDALAGPNAMKAKVGDTVLFVHSQADRDTRIHIAGGFGDYVWETGKFANPPATDLETWAIRGGSAAAALFTFREPGIYAYVNDNMTESVELGACAYIEVEGKWNDDLMTQVNAPAPIDSAAEKHADATP
jgi:nitrite reductase (NO-forming)